MNKINNIYAFSNVDVSNQISSKAGLSYLNWAFVSHVLHQHDPETCFTVHEYKPFLFKTNQYLNGSRVPFNVDPNTGYASVAVTLTFHGHKLTESLPVYDYRGKAVKLPNPLLINKTIKRAEVKVAAELTGLGISLYINGSPKGVGNNAKNNSNTAGASDDATGTGKANGNGNSIRGKNTDPSSNRGASLKQIKYLRYLIYSLADQYQSGYGDVAKEICHKHHLKGISTGTLSKNDASNLIKELQKLLPSSKSNSKPKTNKPESSKIPVNLPF